MRDIGRHFQGIGVSLLVHGVLVAGVLWWWSRPAEDPSPEAVRWDVDMLEPAEPAPSASPVLELAAEAEIAAEPAEQILAESASPDPRSAPASAPPAFDFPPLRPATGPGAAGAVPIPVPGPGLPGLFPAPAGAGSVAGAGAGGGALPDFPGGAGLSPILRIPPVYPLEARRRKIEGWVRIEMTVLEDGSVAEVKVREAKPAGVFEEAAMAAVMRWKFSPVTAGGRAVRRRAGQTLRFELQN